MSKKYKLAVLIGRHEPVHNGHLANMKQAADIADHVLVLVGSAYQPRTIKNPFTYQERLLMIEWSFNEINVDPSKYTVVGLNDYVYNDNKWIQDVQSIVDKTAKDLGFAESSDIAVLGHEKDSSSWYLRAFPSWDFVPLAGFVEHGSRPIDATKIRELMFEGHLDFVSGAVPRPVFQLLKEFTATDEFNTLVDEYNFIKSYKKAWESAPYAPTFFTVDAVVIQGGHVLLVKRKFAPGKGLWALPGGFLNQTETARDACIRELREETGLKVPVPVLSGSITYERLFDRPDRSLRGRTLTQAFLIELNGGDSKLPKVKGSDDAIEARWFTFSEVANMSDRMFEDHHSIIQTMLGRAR